ncbi:hypothetical protein EV182_007087 [Spiromyces aspiralis]|uniref:Uncharacterized protein n=1 Tax=Spiromyces aspiralis TaxID=68401 RepID=A0ACC1HA13_9FUNG|nr:hypothetical protein EV182_007087 [Spiromyces aspiralis]
MLHGKIPRRGDHSYQCQCGEAETVDHITGGCTSTQWLRDAVLDRWGRLVRREYYRCWTEASRVPENLDRRPCIPQWLRTPSVDAVPSFWRTAPFTVWRALPRRHSRTARALSSLWQLCAAAVVHLQWMSRNEDAYGSGYWSRARFTSAYNNYILKHRSYDARVPRLLTPLLLPVLPAHEEPSADVSAPPRSPLLQHSCRHPPTISSRVPASRELPAGPPRLPQGLTGSTPAVPAPFPLLQPSGAMPPQWEPP